jgi:hypothetical protein
LKSGPARRFDPGLEPGRVEEKTREEKAWWVDLVKTRLQTH